MGCFLSCCALETCCCACNLGCCACEAGCAACACCGRVIPCTPSQKAKVWHTILFSVVMVIAWVVSIFADDILDWLPTIDSASENCRNDVESKGLCSQIIATYEVSWSLFAFHLFLALVLIKVKYTEEIRAKFHTSFWCVKFCVYLLLFVTAFFIPNEFYYVYKWFALIGAIIFIFLQLFLLIDFAHTLNTTWVKNYEEDQSKKWVIALSFVTFLSFAVALALNVLSYVYYSDKWTGPFATTLNVVLCLFVTGLSLHPMIQEAQRSNTETPIGILQSGIVSSYASFLVISGLMSDNSSTVDQLVILLGAIFVFASIISAALNISKHEDSFTTSSKNEDSALLDAIGDGEVVPYNYSFFHCTFALGAMYLAMLMTNWTFTTGGTSEMEIDHGPVSMWIKISSSWVVFALYIWTLVAPLVFKDRTW